MSEQIFTNCTTGGPVFVHVKDGKITSIRPVVFDETDAASWIIDVNGRKFSPPRRVTLAPFTYTERANVYSGDRVNYPLKRIDFDPEGNRHPETRGKSGYKRISWDEALDIVTSEMKRINTTYGKGAILGFTPGHHLWGNLGYYQSAASRFFQLLGTTRPVYSPMSWEGWVWGATHTYGFQWSLGTPEQYDLLADCLENTELIIHWSNDPDSTRGIYGAQESALWRLWLKELGKKQIFLDPYCNYTAAILADKWIPLPRPDTGAALALAIAYVWIEENTYDQDYVATHTYGFEEFKRHVKGQDDGIPKSPKWAEEITAIPARTIKALAREWASHRTTLAFGISGGGLGGACRTAYAHELTRLVVLLQGMQGLGKPGVNMWGTTQGAPFNASFKFPGYADLGISYVAKNGFPPNASKQRVYAYHTPDAILNPPVHWVGDGYRAADNIKHQFTPYTYPREGHSTIKMIYAYGGSSISTQVETNKWPKAYQSPEIEFVVNQSIWMGPATKFADVILPACTNFERNDISEWANCGGYQGDLVTTGVNHRVVVYQQKCIEPLDESKSDYEIFSAIAERMGFEEEFTEGNTMEDWIEKMFYASSLPDYVSFEDFKKKGYFVVPLPEDYKPTPALRWFYEGRDCDTPDPYNPKRNTDRAKELGTYSGKIEFVSQSLAENAPDDKERPPMPTYIPSWEDYTSELAKKYPLHLISPHPRFSFHTQHDHNPWLGDIPAHRIFKNGYYWHVTRVNPADAAERGIRDGDIIKLYNDRGAVLGIAQVTERIPSGVIHSYEGSSKYDLLEPGNSDSPDRGGCVNTITPSRPMSKNVYGVTPNSCLVEISRWEV